MIERSFRLRASIDKFAVDQLGPDEKISEWEWDQLTVLYSILAPFVYLTDHAGSMSDGCAANIPVIVVFVSRHLEAQYERISQLAILAHEKGGPDWGRDMAMFRTAIDGGRKKLEKYRRKYAKLYKDLFAPLAVLTPTDAPNFQESRNTRFYSWGKRFLRRPGDEETIDDNIVKEAVKIVACRIQEGMSRPRMREITTGVVTSRMGRSMQSALLAIQSPTSRSQTELIGQNLTDAATHTIKSLVQTCCEQCKF